MMQNHTIQTAAGVIVIAACLATSACRKEEPQTVPAGQNKAALPEPAAVVTAIGADLTAKLAKADALDGAEDQVISKCATCRLRMDGTDANTLAVANYKMKFCSEGCKTAFAKDTTENIRAMQVPEG
jgi:hypothetical protein